MVSPERVEAVGVVLGCVLVAVLVVALFSGVADPGSSQLGFAAATLAAGVAVGALVVARDAFAYETVWAFALGAWLAAAVLVTFATHGRLAVLVFLDTYLDPTEYRGLVLALAALAGALSARAYGRFA